ncbi:thioredoxin family protein [Tenacibaculum finnmarkense]|uniref:thioredoxin family protein n=1 Tax=Tenacibaculum finnmarkense TaxID=2781243 RepID=UPI00187B4D08|nr:thioredoxin family protein [Tenacibaculum finnmarkense]MBE7693324.1 thioredoxin fold domain-containing protein [Tenacibaculum finnmarkense genomovar finnmarkense]MCD8454788.1 thioredoxin family protein [Tenacibaculum finnmarkense genomovar ulcerans]WCC47708.1 thioredoxin family protein [Tenacibaculum finnmarkense]
MKKIFLTLVLILGAQISFAQEHTVAHQAESQKIQWESSFNTAIEKSKSENKPILVFFTGSDWCHPCKRVDKELFETMKFKNFSDGNLIFYKADFPRNRDLVSVAAKKENEELQYRYGINAFPTVVVVNSKGNVLGKKKGAYMAEYYYPFLTKIIKNN